MFLCYKYSMKIIFENSQRPLVYRLKLESAYTADSFMQELPNENWQVEVFKNVGGRSGGKRCTINGVGRYSSKTAIDSIKGSILRELFTYTLSESFKVQWLSVMLEDPSFCKLWGTSNLDEISNYTIVQSNYILDNSHAKIGLHLDNRLLVATGMVYLNKSDNTTALQQSTTFYTDQNKSNPLVIEPKFGTGWAAANTHNSWHEGHNVSSQQRYSLLLGISIDVGRLLD